MSKATCTECGHEWSPIKEPAEIANPRCSECGAAGESIEFEGAALEDDESATPSIVERARREGQKAGLLDEIEKLLSDLGELAPDEKEAPPEFRVQHATLEALQDGLRDSERVSKRELDGVEDDIETIREAVESHDVAERLDKTIADKKGRIEELIEWEANLEERVEDLEKEIERLERERQEKMQAIKPLDRILD